MLVGLHAAIDPALQLRCRGSDHGKCLIAQAQAPQGRPLARLVGDFRSPKGSNRGSARSCPGKAATRVGLRRLPAQRIPSNLVSSRRFGKRHDVPSAFFAQRPAVRLRTRLTARIRIRERSAHSQRVVEAADPPHSRSRPDRACPDRRRYAPRPARDVPCCIRLGESKSNSSRILAMSSLAPRKRGCCIS